MTEPTPRSTPKKMTAVEIEKYMLNLESSLARQSALLRDIEAAMRSPGTNMVGLQTLLKRIERELKG
jgi:hypothetical protein